jgi:zinc/manganese transport system substrate-binding protein
MKKRLLTLALVSALALTGCVGAQSEVDQPLVVATTTIVGDLVDQVGHGIVRLEVLMPIGVDPHDFRPSADQTADLRAADLIVTSGLGLEQGLVDTLAVARAEGVPILELGDELGPRSMGGDDAATLDPHWWLDPNRAAAAISLIAERLSANADDPAACLRLAPMVYAAEANYTMLGHQMASALHRVPPEHRRLFTSQDELGYLADRFGFEVGGVIVESGATGPRSDPDRLADLADIMQAEGIHAVFSDSTESGELAEALAAEVGGETEVVALHLCSLGEPGSGAETYFEMMSTNAELIAGALA